MSEWEDNYRGAWTPDGVRTVGGGTTSVTSVTPGSGATNLGKAEDAAHTSGDVGVMALSVRNDSNAVLAGTDLDYTPSSVDSAGRSKIEAAKAVDAVAGASDTGVPALFVRKDTPATLTPADGDYTRGMVDSLGLKWVREYYAPGYEDNVNAVAKVEQRFTYTNIVAGQATTTIKSAAGFLHAIVFNSAATATNVTTVYDNTAGSGTVIAIPNAVAATIPTTLTFDCNFLTGLTIVTATANGSNMTVIWR